MKIGLEQIVDEPFNWQETLQIPVSELDQPDLVDLGDIDLRGRLQPLTPDHLLQAKLSYAQTVRCTRCLEEIEMQVASDVELIVEVSTEGESRSELELSETELGILSLPEPELETRPLVVEQLHLGIPMKPLCKEDCRGICSECGANLNAGACTCKPSVDPRWSALGKFRS